MRCRVRRRLDRKTCAHAMQERTRRFLSHQHQEAAQSPQLVAITRALGAIFDMGDKRAVLLARKFAVEQRANALPRLITAHSCPPSQSLALADLSTDRAHEPAAT